MKYWQRAAGCCNHPAVKKFQDYLAVISFSLIGLCTMLAASWIRRGFIEAADWTVSVITDPVSYFITVPLAFAVWLYAAEKHHAFRRRFSLPACLLSLCGFTAAAGFMGKMPDYANAFAAYGVVAGLFVLVSVGECWEYAVAHRGQTLVALFAAGVSALYKYFDANLWRHLCHSTALSVYWLLKTLGLTMGVHAVPFATRLSSHYFMLDVFQPCSGLEGIFIFLFLLSALVVLDWTLFRKMPLPEIYLVGFIYMFLVNVLRIATLFLIGHFASKPGAPAFLQSMRFTPFEIAHSMTGMIYYFIAFAVFAGCLYKIAVSLYKNRDAATARVPQ